MQERKGILRRIGNPLFVERAENLDYQQRGRGSLIYCG
jgi:hypothetical protein